MSGPAARTLDEAVFAKSGIFMADGVTPLVMTDVPMMRALRGAWVKVDIGVDFGRITTLRNLEHGLREAVRFARRERDGARDLDADDEFAPQ